MPSCFVKLSFKFKKNDNLLSDCSGNGENSVLSLHRYEGQWVRGRRHGRGKERCADGSEYDGEWREDKRHGLGQWEGRHGQRPDDELAYEGEWVRGLRSGSGKAKYMDGDMFEGYFDNDRPLRTA